MMLKEESFLHAEVVELTSSIYELPWWLIKNLPAVHETLAPSLHWEDLLEEKMATHSSILTWRIPWTEEPGRLQSMGQQRVGHN